MAAALSADISLHREGCTGSVGSLVLRTDSSCSASTEHKSCIDVSWSLVSCSNHLPCEPGKKDCEMAVVPVSLVM